MPNPSNPPPPACSLLHDKTSSSSWGCVVCCRRDLAVLGALCSLQVGEMHEEKPGTAGCSQLLLPTQGFAGWTSRRGGGAATQLPSVITG